MLQHVCFSIVFIKLELHAELILILSVPGSVYHNIMIFHTPSGHIKKPVIFMVYSLYKINMLLKSPGFFGDTTREGTNT